ncbi:MAG: CocE/NonD family hydrolase [Litorimonas sp.]
MPSAKAAAAFDTRPIRFEANGLRLSGLLDTPADGVARGLVIFVHGYGGTDVVAGNWHYDLRSRFAAMGVSSLIWDKPGQGESEGAFDIDQPVESSAREVLAAAAWLRETGVPGHQSIGLWGISRAGWTAPLALAQDEALAFWISVSGVDGLESYGYLLETNWRLMGYGTEEIDRLLGQWRAGVAAVHAGDPADVYRAATRDYRADPFVRALGGGTGEVTDAQYAAYQRQWRDAGHRIDPETGLRIYVDGFDALLSRVRVPVLALFGAKDSSVDWQATRALYEDTLGQGADAALTIRVFPDGNHNLHVARTGSYEEMIAQLGSHRMVDGYYDTITGWLDTVLEEG